MDSYCEKHSDEKKLHRHIIIAAVGFLFIILLTIFLTWAILQPKKPHFTLQEATLFVLNLTQPNLLTINMQVTLLARNPNTKLGIYYQNLDVYATYRGQRVTLATDLPSTYMGSKDEAVWSPFLYGNFVAVSSYAVLGLNEDVYGGMVVLNVKVVGKVKWRIGSWVSGKYHLRVSCPAYLVPGAQSNALAVGGGVKYQLVHGCSVGV